MRSVVLSILVIFALRTYAKDVIPIGNTHDSMHKLVDKLIDRMPHHEDLENTTLGKPGESARLQLIRRRAMSTMSPQSQGFLSLQPRPLFQNSPIWLPLPMQAIQPMQPSTLKSLWGRAKGKSSDSSGAMPERESRGSYGKVLKLSGQSFSASNNLGKAAGKSLVLSGAKP